MEKTPFILKSRGKGKPIGTAGQGVKREKERALEKEKERKRKGKIMKMSRMEGEQWSKKKRDLHHLVYP